MTYESFLEQKRKQHIHSGFDVKPESLSDELFPFQKYVVTKALKAGKFAIFSGCRQPLLVYVPFAGTIPIRCRLLSIGCQLW